MLVMDCLAKSSGLNNIENLRPFLARLIYKERRQFHDIEDLQEYSRYELDKISLEDTEFNFDCTTSGSRRHYKGWRRNRVLALPYDIILIGIILCRSTLVEL